MWPKRKGVCLSGGLILKSYQSHSWRFCPHNLLTPQDLTSKHHHTGGLVPTQEFGGDASLQQVSFFFKKLCTMTFVHSTVKRHFLRYIQTSQVVHDWYLPGNCWYVLKLLRLLQPPFEALQLSGSTIISFVLILGIFFLSLSLVLEPLFWVKHIHHLLFMYTPSFSTSQSWFRLCRRFYQIYFPTFHWQRHFYNQIFR